MKGERDQIITAIEVLSPENKCEGVGMTHFKRMQKEYRARGINRVWIDLLREGERMLEFPKARLKAVPRSPYLITTYLHNSGKAELYPIELRSQIPTIRIPLDSSDLYAILPLQPLISRIYQRGRFRIDYDSPCNPPLTGEDYVIAKEILDHRK